MSNKKLFSNSIILITGGTGSWGTELVTQLLEKYGDVSEVRIYSRGEHKQVEMKQAFNHDSRLRFVIGDVRDKASLNLAMKGVDTVFHLAALKHVPVCENNTWEAVLTNINGTQNVIEAAIANDVKKVIDVSTDKAVEPFNLYGMTKACGEKLMLNANFNYSPSQSNGTSFICIRGGNVIGTNGSVIPLFKKQLLENNQITITDPSMTRFLMSTKEAISLIFTAVEDSLGGELFVMNMPATTLQIIAETMIELFGNSDSSIKNIGVRPGEKIDEVLVSRNEASLTHKLSSKYYVILPQLNNKALKAKYTKFEKSNRDEFSSANADQLTKNDLVKILKKESWLWED